MPPGYIKKFLLAMRITALLLFAAFMQVSAAGLAQRLTLHQKDATLKQVFDAIHQQTGYNFVWSADQLNISRKVDADFKDTPILEALDKCLAGTGLTYTIEEKTVIIKKKEDSLLDKAKALFAQVTITGKVTNETGEPLLGVTVRIKDTQQATATDKTGNYTITVPDEKTIIVFSFVGYESVELSAKNVTKGSVIQLKASSTNLHEVIVNQGYYTRKQEFNTGNVAIVSGEDIQKQPVTDPLLALQGRVAGLEITQTSGLPGTYSTVRIRGQNSLSNGLDPLYIVDGMPYTNVTVTNPFFGGGAAGVPARSQPGSLSSQPGNVPINNGSGLSPFNNLNPADIESVQVLKDADATAIYGSRGANGVILITTRKGKSGPIVINADVSSGWGKTGRKIQMLNTQQYLEMRHEAFKNDNATPDPTYDYDLTYWDTTRYTDWQKVLIGNTAHFTKAQLSASGGDVNTRYLISGAFSDQGTVFPGNYGDTKASGHLSLTSTSSDKKFQLQFTTDYVNDNNRLPLYDFTSAITLAPNAPALLDATGKINWQPKDGSTTFLTNPLASSANSAKTVTNNLITNLNLSYQIIPGLHLQSNFGYTKIEANQSNLNFLSSLPPEYISFTYFRTNNFGNTSRKNWIIEPQMSYRHSFGRGVLDVILGSTFQQNISSLLTLQTNTFTSDALVPNIQFAANVSMKNYYTSNYRYNAAYGRISYIYEEKYLLNLTARRDGSSRFGPGQQFGNFGAVGAGWIFSKEKFAIDNLSWLSFGKLRVSLGSTGNDQLGDYKFLETYSTPNASTYQGQTLLSPTQLTNPYFAWERMNKLEGGVELGFLKDRINFTASYYRNWTNNQLISYQLPITTGFLVVQGNLPAEIRNTGLELDLRTINIQGKDFNWSSSINLTFARNKLVSFPNIENSSYLNIYKVGEPLAVKYLFHSLGVNPQTGLYNFTSSNGNPIFPTYGVDQFFSSALLPKYYGGFQNTINYKGVQLDFLFQFVKQLGTNFASVFPNAPGFFNTNEPVNILTRWQKTGDVSSVQQYTQTYGSAFRSYLSYQSSDAVITDASFIRLKNVSLSFPLPISWLRKMDVQGGRFYLNGQNLLTITKYQGMDPESQGGLTLPPLRVITAGIQINL